MKFEIRVSSFFGGSGFEIAEVGDGLDKDSSSAI
jgi:hypothetical protein